MAISLKYSKNDCVMIMRSLTSGSLAMYSAIKHLLPVLAFLAVGSMQVLGLQRGFVCECGSEPKVTHLDRCDNLYHGDNCHEEGEDEDHGEEDSSEVPSKQHASNKEDVVLTRALGGPLVLPQPLLYVISWEEQFTRGCRCARLARTEGECFLSPSLREHRWPRLMASTIVLRI